MRAPRNVFPYLIKNRIKAVKRISEREQFAKYKADLDKVCDGLLQFDDVRNFLSHGFLTLHVDRAGDHQFEYRMYQRSDGTFSLMGGTTTLERLRAAAEDITPYVEQSVELFKLIYDEQKIENVNPLA